MVASWLPLPKPLPWSLIKQDLSEGRGSNRVLDPPGTVSRATIGRDPHPCRPWVRAGRPFASFSVALP